MSVADEMSMLMPNSVLRGQTNQLSKFYLFGKAPNDSTVAGTFNKVLVSFSLLFLSYKIIFYLLSFSSRAYYSAHFYFRSEF